MNIKEFLALGACSGLKVENKSIFGDIVADVVFYNPTNDLRNGIVISMIDSLNCKPICFSLDHLTKPIRIKDYNGGEPFVPIVELNRIHSEILFDNVFVIKNEFDEVDYPFINPDYYFCKSGLLISTYEVRTICFSSNKGIVVNQLSMFIQLIKWHFAIGLSDNEFMPVTDEFNPYI